MILADKIIEYGGDLHFEWPSQCALWQQPSVQEMVRRFSMHRIDIHGCALGLRARTGMPIKKPWSIMTTSKHMVEGFKDKKCPGPEVHATHTPCAGSETKRTEEYTDAMTDIAHEAVARDARDNGAPDVTAPVEENPECEANDEDQHRPHQSEPGLWCSLVTKTLHPRDPAARSPKARKAIMKELADLRFMTTWEEDKPFEYLEAKKKFPKAHFARLFAIVGVKHFEDPDEEAHVWKGRIVLSGDAIRTASGDWAIFADVGSVPSTMTAARIALACAALLPRARILQSDCIRAYVQAEMDSPDGVVTFVELPKEWHPPSWKGMQRPVCRLLKALYGHPRAGDLWHNKLDGILTGLGFTKLEAWPSVYTYHEKGEVVVVVVYVDDLLIAGTSAMDAIIKKLREQVLMDDPHDVDKYLGVHHKIKRTGRVTEMAFDMRAYLQNVVKNFKQETGMTLKPVHTPYAPAISDKQLEDLMSREGVLHASAASHIMKVMYAARMAAPQLLTSVCRLASEITKWTAESDRKLVRLMAYIESFPELVMYGSLSLDDLENIKIIAWPDADLNSDPNSSRSTSGCWIELSAGERSFPLAWWSKKQDCTATHTCEAETVSACTALKEVVPMQDFLEAALGRPVPAVLKEDNSAALIACSKGYSPAMRGLRRTQRVSIGYIHDVISTPATSSTGGVVMEKAPTATHKGDMFTKPLDTNKFNLSLGLIQVKPWKP